MAASDQFPGLPKNWSESILKFQNDDLTLRIFHKNKAQHGRWLYLIHGQGEQSDRYLHFPHYLQSQLDAIICLDLPGHGLSQGQRGHIESFDNYDQAVLMGFEIAGKWMQQYCPKNEAHWFGHSMGGLISLNFLFKNRNLPLHSVSVSSPLLDLAFPVPPIKKFFGELIEPIWGSLKLSNELDSTLISHDTSVQKSYVDNPLNHNSVSPRFFVKMTEKMKTVRSISETFPYSVLFLISGDDRIVSSSASYEFFRNLKMMDKMEKKLTSFPGYYHESFNEIAKERPFTALSDWIENKSRT